MKISECIVGQKVVLIDVDGYPNFKRGDVVTIEHIGPNLVGVTLEGCKMTRLYPSRFEPFVENITMEFTPREIYNIWTVMGRCSGGSGEQFRTFLKFSSQADVLLKGTAHFESIELRKLREKIADGSFRINQKDMDTYLDALEAYNPNQKAINELEADIKEAQEKLLKLKEE